MSLDTVINVVTGIVVLMLGGAGTVLWSLYIGVKRDCERAHSRIEKLGGELANYRTHVAEHYVTGSELTAGLAALQKAIEALTDAVQQSARDTRDDVSAIHRRIDSIKADK